MPPERASWHRLGGAARQAVLLERGPYIGYASCGLPYHLSGTIPERDTLLPLSPSLFAQRFGVDVRTQHSVVSASGARAD